MEGLANQIAGTTSQRIKHKVTIKDAHELMYYVWKIQDMVFSAAEDLKDDFYKDILDTLMEMSCGDFYIELDTIARKASRKDMKPRMKMDEMRRYAKNNPDKCVICERCDTPLMKRSYAEHLRSKKCKDIHCLVKGTGGEIADPLDINDKVIEIYEKNEPLPEVELNAENYYYHNMFDNEYQ